MEKRVIGYTRDSPKCQTLVPRVPEFMGLRSCTWHLQTIIYAKSYLHPLDPVENPTALIIDGYFADRCFKKYCDDVSNKVHSVSTAVVAVSTARHHVTITVGKTTRWGLATGLVRWGFTTGHIKLWLTGRSTKHEFLNAFVEADESPVEGVECRASVSSSWLRALGRLQAPLAMGSFWQYVAYRT